MLIVIFRMGGNLPLLTTAMSATLGPAPTALYYGVKGFVSKTGKKSDPITYLGFKIADASS